MSKPKPIEYKDATPEVRAVYDDILAVKQITEVNNFWKYLANNPVALRRTWGSMKEVMAPGHLDVLTKELIYVAISVTNGCGYCIGSHSTAAAKAGMTPHMFSDLMSVVGMANEMNRLATGYRVPLDAAFDQ